MFTDEMRLLAIAAAMQVMMPGKLLPMLSLGWTQSSGTVTERTGVSQSGQNRSPDKIRAIADSRHGLSQGLVDFERDGLTFVAT